MLVQVRIRAIFATSPSKIYNQAVERVCLLSNKAQNQKSVPQQPSKPHNLIVLGPDGYILKFLYMNLPSNLAKTTALKLYKKSDTSCGSSELIGCVPELVLSYE
jgi:hypothetical protein